ncbi:MAG: hypothetical protein A4E26_00063 [Methanobacterium sp. PtaU1.Bin097]|nr:MAG: hypothetical protein A4E26_00063 [Methanobacterium sp. PtaU1.Bin097]
MNSLSDKTVQTIESIDLSVDEKKKEILFEFYTNQGAGKIAFWVDSPGLYIYEIIVADEKGEKVVTKFPEAKPITKIGKNKGCQLYTRIRKVLEENTIIPFPNSKESIDKRYNTLMGDIYLASRQLNKNIIKTWEKELTKILTPSWFEYIGDYEDYPIHIRTKANDLLMQNNFVEHVYEVINKKVVAQKSKAILSFLIDLSSVFDKALHSVVTANPGKSKSTIVETTFDLFPLHRRLEFNKNTTESGLMNMTRFKEGHHILSHKVIKLGDFGDVKEQDESKNLISFFKELMSEGKYDKILTDMQDEFGRAMVLRIRGCGSVNLQVVTPNVESQFQSRSLVWSPDDSRVVQRSIKEFQENELSRYEMGYQYTETRDVIACAIDSIFQFVEKIEDKGAKFDVLNPFTKHFNTLLNVDESPNANRDRLMVQTIPKLVTIANCHRRDLFYNSRYNTYALIVSAKDYIYTVKTLGKTLSYFIHKKSEALQTYMDIIENKLEKGVLRVLEYDELQGHFEKGKSTKDVNEIIDSTDFYTYADIAKHTTAHPKTVSRYINELADYRMLYVDKSHSPHRIYVCADYKERKKEAFYNVIDFEREYTEKELKRMDVKVMSEVRDESKIDDYYQKFISNAEAYGWVKCPMSNLDSELAGDTV